MGQKKFKVIPRKFKPRPKTFEMRQGDKIFYFERVCDKHCPMDYTIEECRDLYGYQCDGRSRMAIVKVEDIHDR